MKLSIILTLLFAFLISEKINAQDTVRDTTEPPQIEYLDNVPESADTIRGEVLIFDNDTDETKTGNSRGLSLLFGALAFILLFVVLSVAIVFLIVFSLMIFAGLELVSRSSLAGLWERSYTSSFRTYFFISAACITSLMGGIVGLLANMSYHYTSVFFAIVFGAVVGLILSIPIAYVLLSVVRGMLAKYVN